MRSIQKINICLFTIAVFIGCSPRGVSGTGGDIGQANSRSSKIPTVVVVDKAPVPAGTVQYCWEEPLVEEVKQNPGIDASGNWYHPGYTIVQETRSGKWRPCAPVRREVVGEIEKYGDQKGR